MKIGIVGLPNVGKSTLFNALTGSKAAVANYAFTTIDPNVGIVPVFDDRLIRLATLVHTNKIIPATVEFVDIAGLVKGASQGEGMGNQFLSHIREVDAILHVVRCFNDDNIAHTGQTIDPVADLRTIVIELILADLEHLEKRRVKVAKMAKGQAPGTRAELDLIDRLIEHLNQEKTAATFALETSEEPFMNNFHLLTMKPIMVVANVEEGSDPATNILFQQLSDYFEGTGTTVLPVTARIESEINELSPDERQMFRLEMGLEESSLDHIIREGYRVLGLISFFTGNEKEAHAWTIREGTHAPKAAGTIHTDFERGFIRAEVVSFKDLFESGSFVAAREKGLVRSEGKLYVVRDGDYIIFRFNV
ncbi:MAG TPA: redox-regulated ATPase YchF [Clostridia bacterium]|nr:redox-regulated ATPase YchF [Clostridia bacterium]